MVVVCDNMVNTNNRCKEFLKAYRKTVGAEPNEKIDKRYKPYLAPNDKTYDAHCGYCAEVEYLSEMKQAGEGVLESGIPNEASYVWRVLKR